MSSIEPGLILTTDQEIATLLAKLKRVAVVGIRSEKYPQAPAHYVPAALHRRGVTVVPVPRYEPEVTEILGQPVYRSLRAVPGSLDLVNMFVISEELEKFLGDLLAIKPGSVWCQSGIRNDAFANALAKAGIQVVQDRCLMVDYNRMVPG